MICCLCLWCTKLKDMKDLQEIKDEVAIEDNFYNWEDLFESCANYDYGRLENAIEEVSTRYAQEHNKDLLDFVKSIVSDYENGLIDDIEHVAIRAEQLIKSAQGD